MPYQREIKGIKLLQDRAAALDGAQDEIGTELANLKRRLLEIDESSTISNSAEAALRTQEILDQQAAATPLVRAPLPQIYAEAEARYTEPLGLADILNIQDFADAEKRVGTHVQEFNRRYGLDGWDYAIAGSCGLFAAMLDLLCVRAPMKSSTTPWTKQVDGIFNKAVQAGFNNLIPAELSAKLSSENHIGAPDTSTLAGVVTASNHRLRSLAHDPLLGFIFGVLDMKNSTCTTVVDGVIRIVSIENGQVGGSVFQLLGRMLGHLLSDVNAPTAKGNRGMGLPAPFMGLLRMFEGIPVPSKPNKANPTGWSDFGKQIEFMYLNGYDFRQFTVTSLPMLVMETLMRAFYIAKQMKLYGAPFGETLLDTMPSRLNPRFRLMLAMSYGTSSAVNAGKMYVTGNILNANYASWMGLTWNGFHAIKWALVERHLALWGEVEEKEIASLEDLVNKMAELEVRAKRLPT